jgi:hypothetical protein
MNLYSPALRSTVISALPPVSVSVSSLTPLPSISTACGTSDGLSITIVTSPGFAVSSVLSNLRAPPGSATSVSVWAPPPAAGSSCVVACSSVVAGAAAPPFESSSSSSPQPTATSAGRRSSNVMTLRM